MKYLLDTNICVFLIRNKSEILRAEIRRQPVGDLCVSAITESELRFGADKSSDPARNHAALERFFLTLSVLAFDSESVREYGKIRAFLEKKGLVIGSMDMLIAAHAMGVGLTVVTNNTREFRRVPGLRVVDWTKE